MKLIDTVPQFKIVSESLKSNNMNSNDIDENLVHKIDSKYYTCQEYLKIKNDKNNFKIYHSNVNGISSHFDTLNEFIVQSQLEFDAICISETSLATDNHLSKNDQFNNYSKPFTTNTLSSKGGVAIYIKNNVTDYCNEREDLKICTKEYEAVWIEIKKPKTKNMIIGCIYRHPHYQNLDDFYEYMNKYLKKLSKEN